MGQFLPKGWASSGVNPNKLSDYARRPDRWDLEDWRLIVQDIDAVAAARDRIGEVAPTGKEALADAYWTFMKVEPELAGRDEVKPSNLVNLYVAEEMEKLKETQRLRRHTVGDTVGSALAAESIEPDLETLFDRVDKQVQQAQALMSAMQALHEQEQESHDLEEVIRKWTEEQENCEACEANSEENGGDGQPCEAHGKEAQNYQEQWEKMQQALEAARQAAQQAGDEFEKGMQDALPGIRENLRDSIDRAADEAERMQQQSDSWGLEPGQIQRMPAQERLELARRLNNDRFKRIADLFGAMRNLMLTEVTRKTIAANEEVFDVELGEDLDRILPEQLVELRNPDSKLEFYRKLVEGELLQYQLRGQEKKAQGGILFCEDGSGSMHGERELWAKAVMLCLLHLARMQKRPFHLIHFGSPGQYKMIHFVEPEDWNIDRVLDAAELFFGGGTDFHTPLTKALELLQDEYRAKGAVEGDIVFCTDGMCGVSPDFMESFKEEQERLDFVVWGVNIGGSKADEPLNSICDGRIATVKDLVTGSDVRSVFAGV